MKIKYIVLALTFASFAHASPGPVEGIHTEDNEIVCQMDDFLETKLFVDRDTTYDKSYGVYSPKILEMPTANASGFNNKLFLVQVVSVQRRTCTGCQDLQTIVYRPTMPSDLYFKLEIQQAMNGKLRAIQTRDVDAHGKPKAGSFISLGVCEANEPY